MTMYHGTTKANYEMIKIDGYLIAPVYLTPMKRTAEDYAGNNSSDFIVFEINIDEKLFMADDEFCKENFTVEESLNNGSIYIDSNIDISKSNITKYEDYEEIE